MVLGPFPTVSITLQQDRADLPNLTGPIPLICYFGAILARSGSTFLPKWLQLGCRDLQEYPFRSRAASKYTNHNFPTKSEKTEPADLRLKLKPFPSSSRASSAAPQSLKVLPNASPGRHISELFATSCTTWSHHLPRLLPATNFQLKTTLQTAKTMKIYKF